MNNDTISRQAAIDAFDGVKVDEENCTEYDIGYNDGIDFAVSILSVLPSAERRGRWIFDIDNKGWSYNKPYMCDQCGGWNERDSNYCPHCGAKMEVE